MGLRLLMVCLVLMMGTADAYANSANLLIRVGMVQCGVKEELNYACEYDERCCELKELFWEEPEEEPFEASDIPDGSALIEAMRAERDIVLEDRQSLSLQ